MHMYYCFTPSSHCCFVCLTKSLKSAMLCFLCFFNPLFDLDRDGDKFTNREHAVRKFLIPCIHSHYDSKRLRWRNLGIKLTELHYCIDYVLIHMRLSCGVCVLIHMRLSCGMCLLQVHHGLERWSFHLFIFQEQSHEREMSINKFHHNGYF